MQSTVIYDKPGLVQVVYYPSRNSIVLDWTKFTITLEDLQDLHKKTLDIAQEKDCLYFIAETSRVRTVFTDDCIKWWKDVWVPKLIDAKVKAIVTVLPSNTLATFSTHRWQSGVRGGIIMENVSTFAEAMLVVKTLQGAPE